jgi:hypothetical protein
MPIVFVTSDSPIVTCFAYESFKMKLTIIAKMSCAPLNIQRLNVQVADKESTHGCIQSKRSQSTCQMQCDIILCLLCSKDKFVYFIYPNYYFFCNYIYLLMISIIHKFKVISLSFESPFMHIKHLKCSHQILFFRFECPFCLSNLHHSFPKFDKRFILMI